MYVCVCVCVVGIQSGLYLLVAVRHFSPVSTEYPQCTYLCRMCFFSQLNILGFDFIEYAILYLLLFTLETISPCLARHYNTC